MPKPRLPLKRSTTPLKRSPLKARRTRISPMSAGRRAIADERRNFVNGVLGDRPWCEACPLLRVGRSPNAAVDVHERWTRARGGPIVPSQGLTPEMVIAACRECHDHIHDHPAEAVLHGLLRGVVG